MEAIAITACAMLFLPCVSSSRNAGIPDTEIDYTCHAHEVMAVIKQLEYELDMQETVGFTLCGEKRKCTYTHSKTGICTNKGQYVSALRELKHSKIEVFCCQYGPPVQDHQEDDCHEIVLPQHGAPTYMTTPGSITASIPQAAPTPPPRAPTRRPGNPGQGSPQGGVDGDGTYAQMILKYSNEPPANPTMLVKAIKRVFVGGHRGYSITVCNPRCGRSPTTRQTTTPTTPTPQTPTAKPTQKPGSHEQPKHSASGGDHPKKSIFGQGHHCFSGDMTVDTPFGTKRMDKLRAGDMVLVTSSDAKLVYEPVEWLYHRDPDAAADFLTLSTKSNRTLRLSTNHLLPFTACSENRTGPEDLVNSRSYFAHRLKVGHCVLSLIDNRLVADQVVRISRDRMRGIFSPITKRGTLVVNRVYASCYSSVENQVAQKAMHSVLITARRWISAIWKGLVGDIQDNREDLNIPMPLQYVLRMARFVLPEHVYDGYSV